MFLPFLSIVHLLEIFHLNKLYSHLYHLLTLIIQLGVSPVGCLHHPPITPFNQHRGTQPVVTHTGNYPTRPVLNPKANPSNVPCQPMNYADMEKSFQAMSEGIIRAVVRRVYLGMTFPNWMLSLARLMVKRSLGGNGNCRSRVWRAATLIRQLRRLCSRH